MKHDAVINILAFAAEHDFEIVSYGLAPNPNGFCFESHGDATIEQMQKFSKMLNALSSDDIKRLRKAVFGDIRMNDTPLERLKYHVTGAIERGEKEPVVAIIYGDIENVKRDVLTLREIESRQGSKLLIDVIAESTGETANKFKLPCDDRQRLIDSLVADLKNALEERL